LRVRSGQAVLRKQPASDERATVRSFVNAPPDTWLFASVASLVAIGLVMVFSASSATAYAGHHDPAYFFKRQLGWLLAGFVCAYAAYRIDYHALRRAAPYLVLGSVIGLILVLVPHVGIAVNGARRWIGYGALSLQPSEFAKLALVIYLAHMLSARGDRIVRLVDGLVPLFIFPLLVAGLIVKEPDMGTASLIVLTAFAMYFAAGARIPHLLAIAGACSPWVAIMVLRSQYERARILAFLNPWKDPQNSGFHIIQSLLALGSGGIAGVGLGTSRAKFYLPEEYTDFIYSVLGEELGLVGALFVLALFLAFAYRAIRIALGAPDRFGFFLVLGCTSMIVVQALINIGVVTSSWPVTGVPLPFISFGGSSLIVNLIAVALILNVGRYRRVGAQ
jgi:cell division protein FtsW